MTLAPVEPGADGVIHEPAIIAPVKQPSLSPDTSPVTVIIEYCAQPDQVENAVAELTTLVATVVAVEGDCYGIRVLQDTADPARFLLYERWSSKEAYLGPHFQTPHIQDFISRAAAFMAGPPVIQFWHETSAHARG